LASGKYFFAANNYRGVFISLNKGNDWIPFNYGLGNLRVNTLIVKDNILFAGTPNGVWMHPL
jgi:predicted O-methyltransferase YrrM